MAKSKIFISSSPSAFCIGKLRDELTTDSCEADVWKEAIRTNAGQTKIETLEQLAKNYDFAVIVLTKADVAGRPLQSSTPIRLTHSPSRCSVIPVAGIKLGIGRRLCVASDAEQRTEGVERVEAPVEPKREFVEVGL